MKTLVLIITAVICSPLVGISQTSKIQSGSTNFSIGSMAGTVRGTFDAPTGVFIFNPENLSTTMIDLTIPANSLFTDHKKRDGDAKSTKYLAAQEHPMIRFKSNKVTKKGNMYYADGILTIRNTAKEISLPFSANAIGDGSYTLNSQFELNRLDFGIGGKTLMLKNVVSLEMTAIVK